MTNGSSFFGIFFVRFILNSQRRFICAKKKEYHDYEILSFLCNDMYEQLVVHAYLFYLGFLFFFA